MFQCSPIYPKTGNKLSSPEKRDAIPDKIFGNPKYIYKLEKKIGSGSFGQVFSGKAIPNVGKDGVLNGKAINGIQK